MGSPNLPSSRPLCVYGGRFLQTLGAQWCPLCTLKDGIYRGPHVRRPALCTFQSKTALSLQRGGPPVQKRNGVDQKSIKNQTFQQICFYVSFLVCFQYKINTLGSVLLSIIPTKRISKPLWLQSCSISGNSIRYLRWVRVGVCPSHVKKRTKITPCANVFKALVRNGHQNK